ncbi:phospholipase D family protein [Pseudocolwellia sp. HL-MZ19]|uniref:phospholipase D family protein n=1 Tax=unclassified Pseudocolwellia TaxID=2848178 RepID=UPI003CF155F9
MKKIIFTKSSLKHQIFTLIKTSILCVSFLTTACSSAQQSVLQIHAQENTQDSYAENSIETCAALSKPNQTSLLQHLAPYAEKMQNSTGVYVLEEGIESLLSRGWLTHKAEKTIDIQYFIFTADNIGLIAADYLIKAADRGVKIRLLVDDLMVDAKGDELLKLDAHENLSIKIYNPLANIGKNIFQKVTNLATNFHGFNQRMHNKTFTVDGKVSITGGRNVADEYFGYDHEYNFRDRDVLLLGGSVSEIESSFEDFWNDELSVPVTQLVKSENKDTDITASDLANYDALHQYACDPANYVPLVREKMKKIPEAFLQQETEGKVYWLKDVEYISDIPGKNNKNKFLGGSGLSTDKLIELVRNAKKSIIIQTPYLVTTDLSRDLFKALTDKGVEIKILTNSLASNDNLEAFNGYQRDRKKLLKTGVEIYEFKPDAEIRQKIMSEVMDKQLTTPPIFGLHSKSMVIDDEITVIGTFNLDPRSANLNTESITVIPSKALTLDVKQGMLEEMEPQNAWRTTADWNPDGEVSMLKQIKVKLRRVVPKNIL